MDSVSWYLANRYMINSSRPDEVFLKENILWVEILLGIGQYTLLEVVLH